MEIGIIGAGVVGSSLLSLFNSDVSYHVVDPAYQCSVNFEELMNYSIDILFICLPCITEPDGSIDVLDLENYLTQLTLIDFTGIVVIKSTLVPFYLKKFNKKFDTLNLIYSPEFIRMAHVEYDSSHPIMILIAGDNDAIKYKLEWFYISHTDIFRPNIVKCDFSTASLIKYFINSWLATKVTFMNEFNELFNASETESTWDEFIQILGNDNRIGKSHMQVPGPDKKLGFGGSCFPKDTQALLAYAQHNDIKMKVLDAAVEKNNDIQITSS